MPARLIQHGERPKQQQKNRGTIKTRKVQSAAVATRREKEKRSEISCISAVDQRNSCKIENNCAAVRVQCAQRIPLAFQYPNRCEISQSKANTESRSSQTDSSYFRLLLGFGPLFFACIAFFEFHFSTDSRLFAPMQKKCELKIVRVRRSHRSRRRIIKIVFEDEARTM